MLMDFGVFGMVFSQNVKGVRVIVLDDYEPRPLCNAMPEFMLAL